MRFCRYSTICFVAFAVMANSLQSAEPVVDAASPGEELLREYFRLRTAEIEESCLADVESPEDWKQQREVRHLELREMLGLSPWPEKTPLQPVITGTVEHEDFIVEKLHFQSQPGLYVTGNLYLPREVTKPLPAILYVCGHGTVREKGVSMGNKARYQHHGAWYARNGYVCLTIDTIQLGEIPGIHHGTHHLGMWWWLNRGYTPAGVEAWNGIRAIDYLQSRAEVDPARIGLTGRSGGGATSWYIAALDERIKAAVPAAGITNMHNHIVDRCVKGHCDCMFMVNRYAWDFPLLASLVAPRPLLIVNTDRDPIFPLDGVVDVHVKTRRLYNLLGADKNTGLFLAMGGHSDLQHLQNASFQWFNLHLKNEDAPITMASEKLFKPSDLRVFGDLPEDEKVTTAHEWFNKPQDRDSNAKSRIFKPSQIGLVTGEALNTKRVQTLQKDGQQLQVYEFDSEKPYRLPFYVVSDGSAADSKQVNVTILSPAEADQQFALLKEYFSSESPGTAAKELVHSLKSGEGTQVLFAPRGVGDTRWDDDATKNPHARRAFNLLGTTEDERRAIDTANAIAAIRTVFKIPGTTLTVSGNKHAAFWSLYASLLTPEKTSFQLNDLKIDPQEGPFILAIEQQTTLPELLRQAAENGHYVQLGRIKE